MRREASTDADLARIEYLLERIMSAQDDINAAAAALNALAADVAANIAKLEGIVAALPAPVDTSALNAAVTSSNGVAAALDTATAAFPSA